MAIRSKKKKKSKVTKKNKFSKEIAYLQRLIKYSLRAANGTSEQLDILFKSQAEKLQAQIDKLEE